MVKNGQHQLRIKYWSRNNRRMLRQNRGPKANPSSARFVTSTLGNPCTWRSTTFVIKEIKKSNAISAAFLPTPNMVCRSIWIAIIYCSPMQRNRIARYFFSKSFFYSILFHFSKYTLLYYLKEGEGELSRQKRRLVTTERARDEDPAGNNVQQPFFVTISQSFTMTYFIWIPGARRWRTINCFFQQSENKFKTGPLLQAMRFYQFQTQRVEKAQQKSRNEGKVQVPLVQLLLWF